MPSDGTFGYLVGRLDVLRIECPQCQRFGSYSVARLIEEHGPGFRLTEWLSERTRDCPNKRPEGRTQACAAVMPDLVGLE